MLFIYIMCNCARYYFSYVAANAKIAYGKTHKCDQHCMPTGRVTNIKTIPTFGSCWPFHNPFHHVANVVAFHSVIIWIWLLVQISKLNRIIQCCSCDCVTIIQNNNLINNCAHSIVVDATQYAQKKKFYSNKPNQFNIHTRKSERFFFFFVVKLSSKIRVLKLSNHSRCHMHFCLFVNAIDAKLSNSDRTIDWRSR